MARTATPKRGAKAKPKAGARKATPNKRVARKAATKPRSARGGPTRKELYEQLQARGEKGVSRLSKDEMAAMLKGKRSRA